MHEAVKAGEQKAGEMLVNLFDWLDGLEPQLTTGIVSARSTRARWILELLDKAKGMVQQGVWKIMRIFIGQ
jgi:hypothetical protein